MSKLLQEDGFAVLLEDGFAVLLEDGFAVLLDETGGPQTIAGGVGIEVDFAIGGVARKLVAGSTAIETDQALVGTASKRVTGAVALETDQAIGGVPLIPQIVAGGVAIETDVAVEGTPRQVKIISGATAIETDVAVQGTVQSQTLAEVQMASGTWLPNSLVQIWGWPGDDDNLGARGARLELLGSNLAAADGSVTVAVPANPTRALMASGVGYHSQERLIETFVV